MQSYGKMNNVEDFFEQYMQSGIKLKFVTEDYAPYNYIENGQLIGVSTDVIIQVIKNLKLDIKASDIQVLPWARAYYTAEKNKNTAIFSMARIPEREKLFKWAGPLVASSNVLIAKKSRKIKIAKPSDFYKYRVGVIINDIGDVIVSRYDGCCESISPIYNGSDAAKMINADRIDLWSYNDISAFYHLKKAGYDAAEYEVVYKFETFQLYVGFNLNTPDFIVNAFNSEISKIIKNK